MIEDRKGAVPDVPALEAMDASASFVFYLAGSRYMECARPDSDWDFYVQDTPGVLEFLTELGFTRMSPAREYDGGNAGYTRTIVERKDDAGTIQVQVLSDVHLLRRVRDTIKAHLLEQHIKADKEDRKYLWRELATILSFRADWASTVGAF